MKVLVTGDKGYIGSVLTNKLLVIGFEVKGIDADYYSDCLLEDIEENYEQISKDIRDIKIEDLKGIDAIIHLAALSNDPLGEFDESLTEDINFNATVELASLSKKCGIKRFIFASSQSMYGVSDMDTELDEEKSKKNPITAYAKTKWLSEVELLKMCDKEFHVVCFRPSTVFGASPRLRCDIVFNNFVGCAYTTRKIEIKSDGSPWRPVIHIEDVCDALISGLEAPLSIISGKSYNVGIKNGNYTVKLLAETAAKYIPNSEVIFTGEHGKDSRTYKVSFKRIYKDLSEWYKPKWDLDKGAQQMISLFDSCNFSETDFRGSKTNRLIKLQELIKNNKYNLSLRKI